MKKKKGCLISCSIVLLVFICLAIFITLFSLSRIFSREASPRPSFSEIDEQTFYSAHDKIFPLIGNLNKIRESGSEQLETLELTSEEFHTLLLYAMGTDSPLFEIIKSRLPQDVQVSLNNLWLTIENDHLRLRYSWDTGQWTPFGSYVAGDVRIRLEIADNQMDLQVEDMKIGSFSMAASSASQLSGIQLKNEIDKFYRTDEYRKIMEIIRELKIEDNKIIIRYRPIALKNAILEAPNGQTALMIMSIFSNEKKSN